MKYSSVIDSGVVFAAPLFLATAMAFGQTQPVNSAGETSQKLTENTVTVDATSSASKVSTKIASDKMVANSDKSFDTEATDGGTVSDEAAKAVTNASITERLTTKRSPQTDPANSGWKFAFAPYLYAAGISGTVGARGRTIDIDASFGDVAGNLEFGMMGSFEATNGKIVILNDFVWTRLGKENTTPGGLYSTGDLGVNMFVWQTSGGWRAYQGKGGSLDLLGGVRVTSVETTLDFTSGILPGFSVAQRKTWAAPVFGVHGLVNLSPKFYLSGIADAGGGFGTHFTGQFYGGAGFRITPKIALIGGWRYLKTDYSDDAGFIFDTALNGLVLGAKFQF